MKQFSMFEMEEDHAQQTPSEWRRFLVLMLYLSFFACLVAFLLVGTAFGGLNQILPTWLMSSIQNNRLAVLILPLASLLTCSIALRRTTNAILAGPDRYLDERQKTLRDRIHRRTYSIIKPVCLLIPALFLLQAVLWPVAVPKQSPIVHVTATKVVDLREIFHLPEMIVSTKGFDIVYIASFPQRANIEVIPVKQAASVLPDLHTIFPWPADPVSLAFFGGALLLCLFLMVTTLPLSILAWKEPS